MYDEEIHLVALTDTDALLAEVETTLYAVICGDLPLTYQTTESVLDLVRDTQLSLEVAVATAGVEL